jgi:predicted alpha/beta-hydrolase family hydrolase
MNDGPFTIALPAPAQTEITAIPYPASPASVARAGVRATLVLGHGAGAGQRHPYMVGTAERLRARGISVVTFDFPYMQSGKKLPDKREVLDVCFRTVFDTVRRQAASAKAKPTRLFAGGKSMGGRIASQVAADSGEEGIDPEGLVFLGYPLHPPGKPTQLRDKHLPNVRAPMLFVQGSRDVFGTTEELRPLVRKLGRAGAPGAGSALYAVDGGDHSHTVPKRGHLPQDEVLAAIADAIVGWMVQTSDKRAMNVRA